MPGLRLPLCLDANSALSHKHRGCKYTGTANQVQAITTKTSLADRKPWLCVLSVALSICAGSCDEAFRHLIKLS